MLRALISLLLIMALFATPVSTLVAQSGLYTPTAGCVNVMSRPDANGASHGTCQMAMEHCALACASLPVAVVRPDVVDTIPPPGAHWTRPLGCPLAGLEPAMPELPPKPIVL